MNITCAKEKTIVNKNKEWLWVPIPRPDCSGNTLFIWAKLNGYSTVIKRDKPVTNDCYLTIPYYS